MTEKCVLYWIPIHDLIFSVIPSVYDQRNLKVYLIAWLSIQAGVDIIVAGSSHYRCDLSLVDGICRHPFLRAVPCSYRLSSHR